VPTARTTSEVVVAPGPPLFPNASISHTPGVKTILDPFTATIAGVICANALAHKTSRWLRGTRGARYLTDHRRAHGGDAKRRPSGCCCGGVNTASPTVVDPRFVRAVGLLVSSERLLVESKSPVPFWATLIHFAAVRSVANVPDVWDKRQT
jgi:hypothetical protein